MEKTELSVEQARDLLLSWSKTLVNVVTKNRRPASLGDIPQVLEEVVGAVECLEGAIRRPN
jgi:hypothetical protein